MKTRGALLLLLIASALAVAAGETPRIDLATVLRLAGARSLDVQIARQRLAEADANALLAVEQFFPTVSPGFAYRRHENNLQAVDGTILNADKEQFTAGATATAQVDVGETIFRTLAARQLRSAARHAAGAQLQESLLQAAAAYFDLARVQAAVGVAVEAVRIEQDYSGQLQQAVDAGLAFKGDVLRSETQLERNRLTLDQTTLQQRLAAARLAQILHLDSTVALIPAGGELRPIQLFAAARPLDTLVAEALAARPELKQYAAQLEAARQSRDGAVYGPMIPSINGQTFYGGLGGGIGNPGPDHFAQSSDYAGGLSWRVGPGGLFDLGRIHAHDARVRTSSLELEKVRDEVIRQVVDGFSRIHSLAGQLEISRRELTTAEQSLRLTRQRRELGVGIVLETIQSEQDLTRARLDYLDTIAEHNKAQYGLQRAVGQLPPSDPPPPARPRHR